MASLDELKKSLNVVDLTTNIDSAKNGELVLGKKRRPWVYDNDEDELLTREQDVSPNVSSSSNSRKQHVSNNNFSSFTTDQHVSNSLSVTLANNIHHVSKTESSREQVASKTANDDFLARLLSLSGHEKKLLRYIFKQCQASANLETNFLSSTDISEYLQINTTHLRNLIYRLSKKSFVTVTFFIKNKSGLRKFSINKDVFEKLNYDENIINTLATRDNDVSMSSHYRDQVVSNNVSNKLADALQPVSSSSSLNILTTKEERTEAHSNTLQSTTLPPEWESIDFSFLEDIGFNKNKLLQIYGAGYLTAEMVQESLYGYDFDRKHNNVKVNSPINFLMAQLKIKGLPYDLPKNYESPKVRAMREYLERMEANEKKEQELKDALKTREFEKWLNNLSLEEQNALVPPHGMFAKGGPRRAAFFKHFDENHWAEKEKVLFAGIFS